MSRSAPFSRVANQTEKQRILDALVAHRGEVSIYDRNKKHYTLTLKYYRDDGKISARLQTGEGILYPGEVTINFQLNSFQYFMRSEVRFIDGGDESDFLIDESRDLFKLQRRAHFRVRLVDLFQGRSPLNFVINFKNKELKESYPLADLGAGGMALLIPSHKFFRLEAGEDVDGCIMGDNLRMELRARLCHRGKLHNNANYHEILGFRFVSLPRLQELHLRGLVMNFYHQLFNEKEPEKE